MKKLVYGFIGILSICICFVVTSSISKAQEATIQDEIIVNEVKLSDYPIVINDCTLVPARAVSEKLGFKVIWDKEAQMALIQSEDMEMNIYMGKDLYSAHSIRAIGMTAPISLGSAPLLVNGKLYVPAEIFRILQGNSADSLEINEHQVILRTIK